MLHLDNTGKPKQVCTLYVPVLIQNGAAAMMSQYIMT